MKKLKITLCIQAAVKKKKKKVTVLVLSTSDYTAVLWKITLQTETRSVFLYS